VRTPGAFHTAKSTQALPVAVAVTSLPKDVYMSARARKFLIVAVIVLGVLALLSVLVVPILVDVNRYRPEVAAYLEKRTGKPAQIGRLRLTLFPNLAIEVDDFILGNPKGFPHGDFFRAQRIYALLKPGPLWNRKVVIRSLVVENPDIHLLSNTSGHWNFENPPQKESGKSDPAASGQGGFSLGTISKIEINRGRLSIANLLPSGTSGPVFFDGQGLSCQLQGVNLNALTAPQAGTLPSKQAVSARVIPARDNTAPSVAHGSFHADSVRFGAIEATSVNSQIQVFPKQAYLDDLSLKVAGGTIKGRAASDFSYQDLLYSIQTTFEKIDVAQLLNAFPTARGKMTGTMEGSLDLNGEAAHSSDPLSGLRGTGQVTVRNGKLPTLQLNKNLLLLVRMAGIGASSGDPAAFSLITADLNLADQQLVSRKVHIVSTDVDVDAAGSVLLTDAYPISYSGTARVPARQSGLTNLVAGLSGATFADGKLLFPFALEGTLESPRFVLKSAKGVLGGLATPPSSGAGKNTQPGNAVQDLINIFRKKQSSSPTPKQ
jgi:uncharacterized protein involved in outer membrane biogenesis